ncbi:sodium:solute symporter family transporter [Thalassoroseus pseudoceratinae]|uniref:sodium:solute symporter family transporter n=1 Tax=Thalassoroseus pseudoceratinae TaxID=2713176 RepID=UPI0014237E0C|nr:hypothetical protein [Thalassoroseus pseudoceratinae]
MSEFPSAIFAANSNPALITFLLYTLAVFGIAGLSNQLLKGRSFLSEYFLGSRSLGVWAFALTFAATSSSGGSFTGFPSLIYTHGWILALWISSYMVVPICTMGLLGKRLNQIARISGSITVPDVLRDRFRSVGLGLLAVLLIVFFMSFNLVAQFKAGAMILKTLLQDVAVFENSARSLGSMTSGISLFGDDPQYLLCLVSFGIAVIIYTTYGGFHAVVWTDVMQGVVMVIGVLIMLPLTLDAVGGLENATQEMAQMKPPVEQVLTLEDTSPDTPLHVDKGDWLVVDNRIFRFAENARWTEDEPSQSVNVIEIVTASEKERFVSQPHPRYQAATELGENEVSLVEVGDATEFAYGAEQSGAYVSGPGPSKTNANGFLPLSLAISFFFMWSISGSGQPSNMVRLMAFNSSTTLRRSIFTVAIYYTAIYFPLVIIFCCARVLMPGMEVESDRIMPAMAVFITENAGVGWLAGLLVAAPFAAVMSTVDSFLLMISSALVRDIYQRNVNPDVQERTIKRLSYWCTLIVGTAAMFGAMNPPEFLQNIIVYTGSGLAAAFLAPVAYALYWPRVNTAGVIAAMLGGFTAHLSMYITGMFVNDSFFNPYRLFDFDPILVGLFSSFLIGWLVTKATPPPPADLVARYFGKPKA